MHEVEIELCMCVQVLKSVRNHITRNNKCSVLLCTCDHAFIVLKPEKLLSCLSQLVARNQGGSDSAPTC